ncbi:MAG: SDR family oxidoreductase [Phycisphaeraceae bacterium]
MIEIDLTDKTAVVTGASQGIGETTARRLHAAGANVVINYFDDGPNRANAERISAELGDGAVALGADVRDLAQMETMLDRAVEWFGSLDILVNNAGILRDRTLKKMSEQEWQSVIDTNLTGVFHACKAAANRMNDHGRIVSMASIAASVGFFGQTNYAAAKAGVEAMMRVLSRELARRHITCNTVAPGVVLTDMGRSIPEDVREQMLPNIPLGRFGEPIEISNAILFFCSDLATYITGQTLHVNGGWYA